jgi:zinc finger CCHC domain-containing protein 8
MIRYENEFQNLLGLPYSEDNPPGDTMRLRKPNQECFNCLATSHKIQDCPIKQDQERIDMHRKNYASQSQAAQEQQQLFSSRYTNDATDQKPNRGFEPGKISDELRQALGINKNQLPPFIYVMRELGYPPGWLIDAEVKQSGLSVLDGEKQDGDDDLENGEIQETDNAPKTVNSRKIKIPYEAF